MSKASPWNSEEQPKFFPSLSKLKKKDEIKKLDQWARLVCEIHLWIFTVLGSNIQSLFVYLSIKCDKSPFVKQARLVLGALFRSYVKFPVNASRLPQTKLLIFRLPNLFTSWKHSLINCPVKVVFEFKADCARRFLCPRSFWKETKKAPREPQRARSHSATQLNALKTPSGRVGDRTLILLASRTFYRSEAKFKLSSDALAKK